MFRPRPAPPAEARLIACTHFKNAAGLVDGSAAMMRRYKLRENTGTAHARRNQPIRTFVSCILHLFVPTLVGVAGFFAAAVRPTGRPRCAPFLRSGRAARL